MKPKILITKLAKRLPIFVVATMVPVTLLAQETQLEEVVVTATPGQKALNAIPNSVRIIDQQMLADQLKISTSLLDSLSFSIPSMAPGREKLTSDAVTLRGRTPLYLVDGVPQSTPLRNGKRSGYTLDPDFIDQ
ncbi:MAG: TonB-dependent receptor plug domain-containing protein [Exilibacterium sp.]